MKLSTKNKARLSTSVILLFFIFTIYISSQIILYKAPDNDLFFLHVAVSSIFYLLFVITLIQYFLFKDNTYLYYTLYLLVNLCYFSFTYSLTVSVDVNLSTTFKQLRFYLGLPLLILSYFIYTHFAIAFLKLEQKDSYSYKWLTQFLKSYLLLLLLTILSYLLVNDSSVLFIIRSALLIACMPMGIISIVMVYIRVKNIITRILCIGSLLFFTGSVLGFLFAGEIIPYPVNIFPFNQWVFYTEIGTILEVIMFFSSFAYRNKLLAEEEQLAQQKLQLIRDDIARDLHDDLGASLSNINILNELAKRNVGNTKKQHEYLEKVSEDILHISEGLNDIVWNINPKYDDLENLFIRMKRYAADMMDGKNINYEMDFPETTIHSKIEMDKRKDLYFIFKEAINNLVKYSTATHAKIILKINHKKLSLLIKDNGMGFNIDTMPIGNGLQNMQYRAKMIHANLKILSQTGSGTSILLDMDLN
jgi:signal transduction histidine kinase